MILRSKGQRESVAWPWYAGDATRDKLSTILSIKRLERAATISHFWFHRL
jgi:hypothetical protein